jgi:hypothetical protein
MWYRDDEQVEDAGRYSVFREALGVCNFDIRCLEIIDQVSTDFKLSVLSNRAIRAACIQIAVMNIHSTTIYRKKIYQKLVTK